VLVKGPGTLGNRRTRGHHVIHDEDRAALDHLPPALVDGEGARDVGQSVQGRQPRLVADRAPLIEHREHGQAGGQTAVPDGS
jgi:hypothetical protein